ncbi:MFS transporter [Flavihumibacter stibioxidans]|uniref:MFS transporter n=1 Tax=Flavihumibacter stibioxidans TaxID=1834163 RepID=A0ABR7M5N7_9BACT|nr:MFS transporter [Flavihumibacter stibioxidans]MBC6490332.1 MFS transporter [Flavihumibacter stibioxidans]
MKETIGKYRWTVCALIFFATTINYLDRAVISLLKSSLEKEFSWTETDYSNIVIAFQLAYAIGLVMVGPLVDRVGTKLGYALAIIGWSLAAGGHALVKSTFGFIVARAALGITEAGNFPAAIKTVAEWFPKKERALATGIFNSGTNVGAILAPMTVPFIAAAWGWQWAFIITGATGVIWLVFWQIFYETPAKHLRVTKEELAYINSDETDNGQAGSSETKQKISWFRLLGFRQTWAFILGKFLTDPIWWFYLFWLPSFLKAQYGLDGTAIALPIALVYTLSTVGSIGGGWLPLKLVKKGWPLFRSRKTSMFIYALAALPVIFAQWLGSLNVWMAVGIIGLAAAAHQAWSANIFTTVSDMFPKSTVASVTGLGGMAGALGGILIARMAGNLFDYYKALGEIETGYFIMFIVCGFAYLTAWLIMHFLVPRMKEIEV